MVSIFEKEKAKTDNNMLRLFEGNHMIVFTESKAKSHIKIGFVKIRKHL